MKGFMRMILKPLEFPGCYELQPKILSDKRGCFVKIFHEDVFRDNGLSTNFKEEYYTFSKKKVLRGLHFQIPPHDHVKLVYVPSGSIMDAIVDLRVGSPTFGKYVILNIDAQKGNMLYLVEGIAHGFYVRSERAIVSYKVSTVYSSEHDTGILWNTAGIPWPDQDPLLSERDKTFPSLETFKKRFVFN